MKNEMKPEFVAGLGTLLAIYSRIPVQSMTYHYDKICGYETVEIGFEDGSTRTVNITADSVVAVMSDVAKALM